MTPSVALPRGGDPVETAAFVAHHGGRVVAYLDEVTTPERALRGAGEAFAALRVRLAAARPDDETVARALLSATRAAAARHAGRGPTAAAPHDALETVARLLVGLHADRLAPEDATRLEVLLGDSPAARELAAAFDRAERRYARDRQTPLTGTEVGVIATAMALAVVPAAPAASDAATRRTVVPAPPTAPDLQAPAHPPRTDPPVSDAPSAMPSGSDESAPAEAVRADQAALRRPFGPEDPFGPESLGYVVPRPGLPRPERGPAPPRRRRRRDPSAAPTEAHVGRASDTLGSGTPGPEAPGSGAPGPEAPGPDALGRGEAGPDAPDAGEADPGADAPAPDASGSGEADPGAAGPGAPAPDTAAPSATAPDARGTVTPTAPRPGAEPGAAESATPTTVAASDGGADAPEASPSPAVRATRGVLDSPVVRQLGVPALLLLAVLVAALVAAGAFSGTRDESVPAVPRPTIPTVPGDPRAIPPLP